MIYKLRDIVEKYNLNVEGVIQIGAHHGQEDIEILELGIKNIVYIEPILSNFKVLKERTNSGNGVTRIYFNTALGSTVGSVSMNLASNQNASASILKPKTHLELHPWVEFNLSEQVSITKLDNLEFDRNLHNLIIIDVQGYELEVLKGSVNTLEYVDCIISEINKEEVYEGCTHIEELTLFLEKFGFEFVEGTWPGLHWGDGIFIKSKN